MRNLKQIVEHSVGAKVPTRD